MTAQDYVHQDTPDLPESERLQKLEGIFNPRTMDLLVKIGIRKGHSFLEVGPGRGGLLDWIFEKVGEAGKVAAVDLNTRFIDQIKRPNFRVQKGDLTEIDLDQDQYDLIHERFVLTHIADYETVLKKMTAALKPGGWILLEDADFSKARIESNDGQRIKAFHQTLQARQKLFSGKNIDFTFGEDLSPLLEKSGFTHIQEEVFSPLVTGGSDFAQLVRLSTLQLWDQYLQTGTVTQEALELYIQMALDPNQSAVYYSTVSAWGQKPL